MLKYMTAAVAMVITLAGCKPPAAPPAPPAPQAAKIGAFGLDLADRDLSVKPGNDFYRYAIGNWLDSKPIPADRTVWGTFSSSMRSPRIE